MAVHDMQCLAELGGQSPAPIGHLTDANHEPDPYAISRFSRGKGDLVMLKIRLKIRSSPLGTPSNATQIEVHARSKADKEPEAQTRPKAGTSSLDRIHLRPFQSPISHS